MKKKILFIINSLEGGGAEKVLIDILKYFDYTRFDVELLLIWNTGVYMKDVPKEVKIRHIYSRYLSFSEKLNYVLFHKFGLLCAYKYCIRSKISKRYDTIISFLEGFSLFYHQYVIDKADKNISWIHTDLFNNNYNIGCIFPEEQKRWIYEKLDAIVCVSNDAKKQFERAYPDNTTKKFVILNPIDYDYISNYKKEYICDSNDKQFEIVTVGRLVLVKAYDRLIRLAKRLREENYNFHITIIGEGSERDKLEGLIANYGLQNYVSLPGFFKPPYSQMANANLFISVSESEAFSLVLCEAFCLGLPVISTKTTGPIELIDNDKYGILVNHDDESIYQAVKRMIDDEQLRLHYHNMSLKRTKIFNIKETIKQVYNVL